MDDFRYICNIHDDANNDRVPRSTWGTTTEIKCGSHQNLQTYQWGKIFHFAYSTVDERERQGPNATII